MWPAYFGITAVLVLIVVALAGGIIWYNWRKSTDFVVAAAERQMAETGERISDRVKLLYDPLYAIVGIASQAPELYAPLDDEGHLKTGMLSRIIEFYPQILSLYIAFENGNFFMLSHVAGEARARFRHVLGAPENAAFANKIVTVKNGVRLEQWAFLDDDGVAVRHTDAEPSTFDPRQRPWYAPALHSDHVELSNLYIFTLNNEPGFTLSRSFRGATGVFGADLAAKDLSHFLSDQRITTSSLSFIFTRSGELVAHPDGDRVAAILPRGGEIMVALPRLSALNDPVASGLFAAFLETGKPGNVVFTVAGRSYIGRVVELPARYGRNELLGIAVPIDEIAQPVIELRNETLFYSVGFLVFALPLYITLIFAWIDRRLAARPTRFGAVDDD